MNPLAWCYKVTPRLDYEPCVNSGTDPMSLPSPTIITPFMIATMNPLAWCCNVTRLGHRAEGSTMGELATMAVPTTNTKRRTVHCSKHAFAPIASFRPKNAVAPNVTLPVQRHQTCLRRAGLASESLVTGDDPLNATDPLGLIPSYSVYRIVKNGKVRYIGKTKRAPETREKEHRASEKMSDDDRLERLNTGDLTPDQAAGLEQVSVWGSGGVASVSGSSLENIRNPVGKSNDDYEYLFKLGQEQVLQNPSIAKQLFPDDPGRASEFLQSVEADFMNGIVPESPGFGTGAGDDTTGDGTGEGTGVGFGDG